ncbi:kinase-like protein, partial [Marasmius fiardii PR-910]
LALRFLHYNGIVHQDVKPANVMVSPEGHIVLSDFGASTTLPFSLDYDDFPVSYAPAISTSKTYHPVVLQGNDVVTFTPSYAAPELMRRNDVDLVIYDERVDWFSFGALLYELATG